MAKKKIMNTKKANLWAKRLLTLIAILLLLAVLIPSMFPNASGFGIDQLLALREHFIDFWMIYTFIIIILVANLRK